MHTLPALAMPSPRSHGLAMTALRNEVPPDARSRGAAVREPMSAPVDFDALYDAQFDFVSRTLFRLGVASSQLDDAAQDVFIVVHRRLSEFRGDASVRTWLFQIARRVAHDHRRTVKRKGGAEPLDEAHADDAVSPHESVERRQSLVVLQRILERLDDDQRAVFVLAELEQMTAPEIASAVGANVNTVYSRLRLAREAFNAEVARYRKRSSP